MQPDGCATRRCRSQARDLLSQPLWRCLKDKSITHSSSKAAATAGFAAGKTATSCAPKAHLRDQRFFQMNPEIITSPSFECVQKNPENKKGLVRVSSN